MFLGGFRHPPNVDAMQYFVYATWPLVQGRLPLEARLIIVSFDPSPSIQKLANDRIIVTGYVEDLTDYFDAARVFISPLRYGAGIKGKVVQSLAYGTPAVVSPIAAEGIGLTAGREVLIAAGPVDFADQIARLYTDQELWHALQQAAYHFCEPELLLRAVP
jgi:glycosyltransferase involved in cell wall biosynthesis